MTRLRWIALGLLTLLPSLGCSMCCTPFDDAYPAYGGKWQRTDRFRGRVGSAFDPAGPEPGEMSSPVEPVEGKLEPTPAMPLEQMSKEDDMSLEMPPAKKMLVDPAEADPKADAPTPMAE